MCVASEMSDSSGSTFGAIAAAILLGSKVPLDTKSCRACSRFSMEIGSLDVYSVSYWVGIESETSEHREQWCSDRAAEEEELGGEGSRLDNMVIDGH